MHPIKGSSAAGRSPWTTAPGTLIILALLIIIIILLISPLAQRAGAQEAGQGICQRTQAVQEAIVAATGAGSCSNVTAEHLAVLTALELSGMNITELNSEDLDGLTRLETLDLSGNGLTALHQDMFDDLAALQELDVSDNAVNYLGNPFHANPDLRSVELSANQVDRLPANLFERNPKLRSLNLEHNLLQDYGLILAEDTSGLDSLRMAGNPGAPFAMPVEAQDLGDGAFQVTAGGGIQAPSRITASLSSTGGTLSHPAAVIPAGETASQVLSVNHEGGEAATVAVTSVTYDRSFYTGVEFVPGETRSIDRDTPAVGICSRTREVQDAIIAMVGRNHACAGVTGEMLANLPGPFVLVGTEMESMRPGDMAGLTGVKDLYLYGNELTELPPGLFRDAGHFERVLLQDNPGSDFRLEVNIAETEDGSVRAVIEEGTPFWTRVSLDSPGGTVHPRVVNIYGGNTRSDESISVSGVIAGENAAITVEMVWFQDTGLIAYSYHDGFDVVPGRDIRGSEDRETTPGPSGTATPTPALPAVTVESNPPGPPLNLSATAVLHGIRLEWNAPSVGDVAGYQVLRRRPFMGEKTLMVHLEDTGSAATAWTDTEITPGTRHTYRVKAIGPDGQLSQWSNYDRATPE